MLTYAYGKKKTSLFSLNAWNAATGLIFGKTVRHARDLDSLKILSAQAVCPPPHRIWLNIHLSDVCMNLPFKHIYK